MATWSQTIHNMVMHDDYDAVAVAASELMAALRDAGEHAAADVLNAYGSYADVVAALVDSDSNRAMLDQHKAHPELCAVFTEDKPGASVGYGGYGQAC